MPGEAACFSTAQVGTCGANGLFSELETCALGCQDSTQDTLAHCAHIVPVWLPQVCDVPAAQPTFSAQAVTLDTGLDANCASIISQPGGPDICVVRAKKINFSGAVRGVRAIALVADDELVVGNLDASADGTTNGPGGGATLSGTGPTTVGGGGAGFKQVGAAGGGGEFSGGSAGGPIRDPLVGMTRFEGGAKAQGAGGFAGSFKPQGGGGGGGVLLIACTGTAKITGTVDLGGGGGGGGGDAQVISIGVDLKGAGGGGSGGYLVVQGARVEITGQLFANGGGGGGGCSTDDCVGATGQDGKNQVSLGNGAPGAGQGTPGGRGGVGTTAPAPGTGNQGVISPGGGGGSTGRFQVYVPAGVTATIMPTTAEPPVEPVLTVNTK